MGQFASRAVGVCTLFALVAGLCACGGGGGGSSSTDGSDNDLVLVKFSLTDSVGDPTGASGTTNAYRNNRLRFTFSAPIDPTSVGERTIQIGIPSGTNLFLTAAGRFTVDGNVVVFDPTVTVTNAPHPFGFQANSVYSVTVKGPPEIKTLVSTKGKTVLSAFTTSFTTTDLYLPDLDQPCVLSISPAAQADIPADRFSQEAQDIWVKSSDDVVVTFSEAMNPATFDPETSFTVLNTDRNREVLGQFRFSDDGTVVTFRPTFGFGRGPYIVRVGVTVDITDLAGNAISNPQQWEFLTEFDQTAVNEGVVEEYFDDSTYHDTSYTPSGAEGMATWNSPLDPGLLASTFGTRTSTLPGAGTTSNYIPLGGSSWISCRFQSWNPASEMGTAGTITGLSWFAGSVLTQGAVNTNFIMKIGHNNTSSGLVQGLFDNNFNVGTPVTVVNAVTYTMPTNMVYQQPVAFPAFSTSFGYNGTDNVVIDIGKASTTGSGNTWSYGGASTGTRRIWNTSQASNSSAGGDGSRYPYVVSFRTESSVAQSLWYRTETNDPTFLDAIISPTEQPAGTETVILFEGAYDDGNDQPDPTTFTGMIDDATDLSGYEYIRFRATFKANLGTGVGPKIEEIVVPYLFF